MSEVLQASEIEVFYGVLHEFVKPMLASDTCVKCITKDGSITFTSDVENLLSSLDIEHAAGELVIQALQSHQHRFGTGTKTLLFMIASLAKAVTQLHKLGIPSETTLHAIHGVLTDLSIEVEEISIMSQEYHRISNGINCHETFSKSFTTEEKYNRTVKPELNSVLITGHKRSETIYPCFENKKPMVKIEENMSKKVIYKNSTDDKIQEPMTVSVSANTEPVYLKMSNMPDCSGNTDDVAWFFDCNSSHSACTGVTSDIHTIDQSVSAFSSKNSNCLLCTENQDCATHCFNDTHLTLNSSDNILKRSSDSESGLRSMDCKHQHNKFLSDLDISSFKDGYQHDLDFEHCFDEIDKEQQLNEVIKPVSSGNVCHKDSDLFKDKTSVKTHGLKNVDTFPVLFNSFDEHCFRDISFNEDSKSVLFDSLKYKKDTDDDNEFVACINDIEMFDSSVTCNNGLIASSNSCEHQAAHYHCEVLKEQRHNSSLFPVKCSNALSGVSFTETIPGIDLTSNAVAGKKHVTNTFCVSDKSPSAYGTPESEIEKLNIMLNFLGTNRSPVNLSTSSRHFQNSQYKNLQPASAHNNVSVHLPETNSAIWCSESSSLNLSEDMLDHLSVKNTSEFKDVTCRELSSVSDIESSWQGNTHCDKYNSEIRNFESDLQEIFFKDNPGQTNLDCVRDIADTFSEVSDIKTGNKDNKSIDILLEQLLTQKKAQCRLSLTERIATSSRHFCNSSRSTSSWDSSSQEDYKDTLCSLDGDNANSIVPCSMLTSRLSNMDVNRDMEGDRNVNSPFSLQHGLLSSSLSDLKIGKFGKIDNHAPSCHLSDKVAVNSFGDLTSDSHEKVTCVLSGEAQKVCSNMISHKVISYLHDCHGEIAEAAKCIFQNQIKEKEKTRFNFHLVDCMSLRSSASSVYVLSGLVIPCDTVVLETLDTGGKLLATLLINADLTPNFHHKGYRPTLSKRTFIAGPCGESQESEERLWCVSVFDVISQLNVKLVLVKGRASSILLDMCEGAGVFMLTSISHHTLSVLSHLHRVDMLTYIALATEENLCNLSLQPLSATWMDHFERTEQNTAKHFAVITNTLDVQTVIFHCSSTMSAQLLEERFWKCLHSIVNSQVDGQVLPGRGQTEIWCADRIHYKSESALANQSHMLSVILEAVADIFHDYYRTVRLNTRHEIGQHTNQIEDRVLTSVSAIELGENMALPLQAFSRKINLSSNKIMAISESQKDKKDYSMIGPGSFISRFMEDAKQSPNSGLITPNLHNSNDDHVYDNFQSKIVAWVTAVDVVSVLQSLGSLVISGVDSNDITGDMVLL